MATDDFKPRYLVNLRSTEIECVDARRDVRCSYEIRWKGNPRLDYVSTDHGEWFLTATWATAKSKALEVAMGREKAAANAVEEAKQRHREAFERVRELDRMGDPRK